MGDPPSAKHTIERANNDFGYFAANCYWATKHQQTRNKRTNHNLTFSGRVQCLADWAREFNVHPNTLFQRLKRGWSLKRALTTPSKGKRGK
jgi:hypothetical protein